jgi:hypothetical protein
MQMDPNYEPPAIETRQVYGISMQQKRNDCKIDASLFENVVTKNKEVSFTSTRLTVRYPSRPSSTSLSLLLLSNTPNPTQSATPSTVLSTVSVLVNSRASTAPDSQETRQTTGGSVITRVSSTFPSKKAPSGPTRPTPSTYSSRPRRTRPRAARGHNGRVCSTRYPRS